MDWVSVFSKHCAAFPTKIIQRIVDGATSRTPHLIGRIGTHLNLPVSDAAIIFASNIGYRRLVNLVPVRFYDAHEPGAPVPPRHNGAMFEITC